MLVLNHYFLKENERLQMEEFILRKNPEISIDAVYKLDDKEIMSMYKACMDEEDHSSRSAI